MTKPPQAAESWIAGLLEHRVALGTAALASTALIVMLVLPASKEVAKPVPSSPAMHTQTESPSLNPPRYAIPDFTGTHQVPAHAVVKNIMPDTPAQTIRPQLSAPETIEPPATTRPATLIPAAGSATAGPDVHARPQKPEAAVPGNTPGHVYFVQVGAYRERSGAQQQAAMLLQQGWNSTVAANDHGLYTVRIGPVSSRRAADDLRTQLLNRAKLKGFVVEG